MVASAVFVPLGSIARTERAEKIVRPYAGTMNVVQMAAAASVANALRRCFVSMGCVRTNVFRIARVKSVVTTAAVARAGNVSCWVRIVTMTFNVHLSRGVPA